MRLDSIICEKIFLAESVKIEKRLSSLLKNHEPVSLYEPCSYILQSGGKHLRPILLLFSAKAAGADFSFVSNAAVAVEVLHNFTLVHDDIMDNSDMRRGRLTLHKKYDLSTAILAGDNLIAHAYKNLTLDCSSGRSDVISSFTQGIIEVCEGQSMDKEFEVRKNVSISEYKIMIYKKTAALLENCCKIGVQLADADRIIVKSLSEYGKNLGMAFQIQDDLLDIIADERKFGKKVGIDLVEGKKTFLFLRAFEKAKGADKKLLLDIVKNKGIKRSKIDIYRSLYSKLGVINDAEREILKYTKLAVRNLSVLPDNEGKDLLLWLANILIKRNK